MTNNESINSTVGPLLCTLLSAAWERCGEGPKLTVYLHALVCATLDKAQKLRILCYTFPKSHYSISHETSLKIFSTINTHTHQPDWLHGLLAVSVFFSCSALCYLILISFISSLRCRAVDYLSTVNLVVSYRIALWYFGIIIIAFLSPHISSRSPSTCPQPAVQ